jgi:hypothetical protein
MAEKSALSLDEVAVRLTGILGKPIARHSVARAAVAAGILNPDGTIDAPYVPKMAATYRRSYGSRWFAPTTATEPKPAA